LLASAKGTNDKSSKQNTRIIDSPSLDTVNFLTAEESFNVISNNEAIKDEVAAGIYYKDIGSRKDLTVAESDVEYSGASATVKTVYRNKAITDIRKLTTEGLIKINRSTQDVAINVEKAGL